MNSTRVHYLSLFPPVSFYSFFFFLDRWTWVQGLWKEGGKEVSVCRYMCVGEYEEMSQRGGR